MQFKYFKNTSKMFILFKHYIIIYKHGGKKWADQWNGVLVLIIGIISFIMTKNYHTLIAPVILFLYGVYRLVFVK